MNLIDLSQPIYTGMPVFSGHPEVSIEFSVPHDEDASAPSANKLTLGEHTGTHVDAFNHFTPQLREQSIDTMPLEMFFTSAFCLDFSHKRLLEMIRLDEVKSAIRQAKLRVRKGDTILLYTDHYRRHYETEAWPNGPGISEEVAQWFGQKQIAGFGVETRSPGVRKVSNRGVHRICGELGFTHYENLVNLDKLVGVGRFQFIALPLKIRGGTGSPVRAVAILP